MHMRLTIVVLIVALGASHNLQSATLADLESEIRAFNQVMDRPAVLKVKQKFEMNDGNNHLYVTVHGETTSSVYRLHRLTIWKVSKEHYEAIESFEAYDSVRAKLFEVGGKSFLFVQMVDPSAGAEIVATAIYYLDDKGVLQTVPLNNHTECYLPTLSIRDVMGSVRGNVYTLQNGVVSFRSNIWLPDDSPNFPTGGSFEGEIRIVLKTDGTYVADVVRCEMNRENK